MLLARGSLGNPWLFEQLLGPRDAEPDARRDPRRARLGDRARVEHLGAERADRYLRKFYPWYVERLGGEPTGALGGAKPLQAALQTAPTLEDARAAR